MSEEAENEDGYFNNDDGLKIARKYWKPEINEPRALVFICHGLLEHYRAYDAVAKPLTDKGILVFSQDQVGRGKSDRCHVTSYDKYIQDVVKHVNMMKEKHPNCPVFIIGHSMGGLIAMLKAQNYLDLFKVAKVVAVLAPQLHVGKVSPTLISRDPEVVKRYAEDPLNYYGGVEAKWATVSVAAMNTAKEGMKGMKLPWLCTHRDQDKIVEISGSELLYKDSGSEDKTFTVYKGCYHQVHKEPDGEGEKCIQEMTTWINSRI